MKWFLEPTLLVTANEVQETDTPVSSEDMMTSSALSLYKLVSVAYSTQSSLHWVLTLSSQGEGELTG